MSADLVLEDTPDGLQVYFHGRRLYGPSPRTDAVRRITSLDIPPQSLVFWPSPLVWHGWRELLGRLGDADAVIACEADPVLASLAREHFPREAAGRIVFVDATPAGVLRAHRDLGQDRFRRVVEVTTSGSALAQRARYRSLARLAEREIRVFWQNRLTLAAFGRLWIRNLIDNVPELATSVGLHLPTGPAIVCGAGPSLEHALPLLRTNGADLTVIAADTALPVLNEHDVQPDLVVALEGQLVNLYDVLPVSRRDYCLVADLSSHPATARLHRQRAWTLTKFAPVGLLDRVKQLPGVQLALPPLGSVGVSAVELALRFGVSPLFCTGLDFAILPGKTHARGAPAYREELLTSDRLHPVRDRGLGAKLIDARGYGGTVSTTYVLQGYADELASTIGERTEVAAVEPFGLSYGALRLSAQEARSWIERASASGCERSPSGTAAGEPDDEEAAGRRRTLRQFILSEIERLEALDLSEASGLTSLPADCDYLACEIPDRIETLGDALRLGEMDDSARVRLRIARDYYRTRWRGALSRLDGRATPRRP